MKEHGRGFQNMYGTYSLWWFHAELRPSEVDPRFNFFFYKNYTVIKNPTATIFEGEVPKRIASFETHFFRTLFVFGALLRKLWPWVFSFFSVPYFCWQIPFCRPLPTSDRKNSDKKILTYLSYRYSESWVRGESVGAGPRKVSICKFGATDRFIKKHRFSLISASPPPLQSIGLLWTQFWCHHAST